MEKSLIMYGPPATALSLSLSLILSLLSLLSLSLSPLSLSLSYLYLSLSLLFSILHSTARMIATQLSSCEAIIFRVNLIFIAPSHISIKHAIIVFTRT